MILPLIPNIFCNSSAPILPSRIFIVSFAKDSAKVLYSNDTSATVNPADFKLSSDAFVNDDNLVITFSSTVPALLPLNPKSYNLDSIAVVSWNETPAC